MKKIIALLAWLVAFAGPAHALGTNSPVSVNVGPGKFDETIGWATKPGNVYTLQTWGSFAIGRIGGACSGRGCRPSPSYYQATWIKVNSVTVRDTVSGSILEVLTDEQTTPADPRVPSSYLDYYFGSFTAVGCGISVEVTGDVQIGTALYPTIPQPPYVESRTAPYMHMELDGTGTCPVDE
jgi:hypothetical protein